MTDIVSIGEVEKRMRPGAWSQGGFLGESESLEDVIADDARTLEQLGISYEVVAKALANLLNAADEADDYEGSYPEFSIRFPEKTPRFDLENLPDNNVGLVVGDVQIFFVAYMGVQLCPWGNNVCGNTDFLILNRKTGEFVTGPGLIVHLIYHHHFFEGHGSPYRVDPTKLIRVLGLRAVEQQQFS